MKKNKTLQELFSFPGFKVEKELRGKFGDFKSRVIFLVRQKKQPPVLSVVKPTKLFTITKYVKYVISMQQAIEFISAMSDGVFIAGSAKACAWKG
jgi:hypothetical protein